MDDRKMEVIQQLMEELQGMMQPGVDDMSARLGRPKVEIEMGSDPDDMGMDDDSMGPDDDDMGMDEPGMMLKKRIMKMRA